MDTERACVMLITLEKTNLILRRKLSVHQYSALLSNNYFFSTCFEVRQTDGWVGRKTGLADFVTTLTVLSSHIFIEDNWHFDFMRLPLIF